MPTSGLISLSIDRSRHTVLVVDDNPATRYSTSRVLKAAGFQTLEAETGAAALALARKNVSAIVLDVHLPDMDGFEVCRVLRAHPQTSLTPVIHLSAAFVGSEHKIAGLNAGADAYMVHPAEPPLLVATLQALIRARTAEERMRESEKQFRAIYDQAPVAIMLVDAQGRFADLNPQAEVLFQREKAALVGTEVASLAPPAWREVVLGHFQGSGSASWRAEFPLLKADGREMMLNWNMSEHVEPGLHVGIVTDLTEQRDFERRRQDVLEREQAARVLAERHSRTKDDFVAVLSHELRTPLTLITGWVHMMRRAQSNPETIARGLDAIERGAQAQGRIISDILDVSRLASGKLRLHREWANPLELMRLSLDALRDQAQDKDVQLQVEHTDAERPAWLDTTRFQQIVWNLTTNAIKFSARGGVVTLRLQRSADELTLTVQDRGCGIDPAFLPFLFDRFTQSTTPGNRAHGGLGLGMSIVRHLAELHGGSVFAFSEGVDKGTLMTVHLDVAQRDAPQARQKHEAAAPRESRLLQGKDILVVEDNDDTGEMLRVVLTDEGASVRLAPDYEAALREFEAAWPDLLVSDIGLPGRDGYDLIGAVREMEAQAGRAPLRAVALTAFARPQDRGRALAAGFDVHLDKPLQPHILVNALLAP